ncbi:Ger(x)C family spore germination protein [Desulforamulus putei]|uniref:Germination protein, Ger(X)C family n=1 Tax=Desulforamulus putei DSM 12395 TaxID=1121429 RepID=A0A1M4SYH0_9FIRM|nr:Ger(x)C family spore germination protein [Desulforamulus putei]SHE37210.1 germination protein, Ger(x)C family [Desulforamulus putei DSM 12395]
MMRKPTKFFLLAKTVILIMAASLCTGCFGGRETDEVAIILAVGIDKGKTAPLEVTVTVANPKAFAAGESGGGGQEDPFLTASVEGPSIWECYLLFNSFGAREMSFQHTRAFIFGEEIAREGLLKYINALLRYREVRRNSSLFVCQGTAKEFMQKNKPRLEASPAKQYEFMQRMSQITGLFPDSDIHRFYITLKSLHSSPTAALVGITRGEKAEEKTVQPLRVPYYAGEVPQAGGKSNAEFIGTAVFRKDKMIGKLTGDESRTMLLLSGHFDLSTFTLEDPQHKNNVITLRLRQGKKPDIEFKRQGDKLLIHEKIYLEGEFWYIQSGENYEDPKKKKIVEEAFDRQMEQLARQLVNKTKEKDYGDIFGFDRYYRKQLSSWEEWEKLPWKEIYDQADIVIDFNTNIRRTGLMRKESLTKE